MTFTNEQFEMIRAGLADTFCDEYIDMRRAGDNPTGVKTALDDLMAIASCRNVDDLMRACAQRGSHDREAMIIEIAVDLGIDENEEIRTYVEQFNFD